MYGYGSALTRPVTVLLKNRGRKGTLCRGGY